jgi:hypothetical protein
MYSGGGLPKLSSDAVRRIITALLASDMISSVFAI